ncbi:ras-related protein Rab-22A-like [Corticium candelabrum]|uniref:ras-related protein Rab-22A-like n=1 Tax=Corticium candelabrum TaxID=121492 RepID=UPI002E259EDC|nr:ras-related protein Rab-22A-like [Corticium candelabrum]
MSMREIKLCLLGDAGVGKSCLVLRFVSDTFTDYLENTIGASFMSKTLIVDDRTFKYQIWDTAGQEKYRGLAPMYYRGAAAAIVVYDVTNAASFKTLQNWIKELKQLGPRDVVIAIAGNKCDLADQRQVLKEDAAEYAESVGALFAETSAKMAVNVQQLFIDITKSLPSDAVVPGTPTSPGGTILLHEPVEKERKKKGCC